MESSKIENKEWIEFLSVIKSNFWLIVIFVVVTCIAAVIITLQIPKKYTSKAVVFPTESNSLDDAIGKPQFGYDVEADRLIQLLESRMIRDRITRKFNLADYYKIDTTDLDWQDQLTRKFYKDIYFQKTKFMSVVITARTKNPQMSADIVNDIVSQIGVIRDKLLKSNVYLAITSMQKEYDALKSDLDSLSGVIDRMTMNRPDVRQYLQTEKYVSMIFDKKQFADDNVGKAIQLVINLYNIRLTWFYDIQTRLKNAVLMSQRPLPAVYIVESAVPSYKKSYPHISTNLTIAFVGSSIFITVFLFLSYKFRHRLPKI